MKAVRMMLLPVCMGLITLLAAHPAAASRAERLASFEKYASQAVAQFRYFQLIGFETLSDDTVAVWTGVNKVYLIKVRQPCPNLDFAGAISLSQSQARVFSQRFDQLSFDHTRCMVESIRPVDYKAMRMHEKAADQDA